MCCLFGFYDYGHQLTRKQRSRLLSALAVSSEVRGTDATGIAYNARGKQIIYKRPIPAHLMWFRVPAEATAVMGHTRMATGGDPRINAHNHPFPGNAGNTRFALAHNGVLYNDKVLRRQFQLPETRIETDSYIGVQLLEKHGKLDFTGLRFMAEELEGSFTITALSDQDRLYFVKGNNPIAIRHFPEAKIYVYASTEEILQKALGKARLPWGRSERIRMHSGELLCMDERGRITRSHFDDSRISSRLFLPWTCWEEPKPVSRPHAGDGGHLRDIKAVAGFFGLFSEDIDALIEDGLTLEEIEDFLYCR